MKHIKQLSNEELLRSTEKLAQEERRITTELLWHLREVDARKLYAALNYPSLHDYVIRHLHYSEGAAHRRIASMRLLRDLPEAEHMIESGLLSLSTAATLQSFFRAEKRVKNKTYSPEQKRALLQTVAPQSKRECERTLAQLAPERAAPRPEVKALPCGDIQMTFVATTALEAKLQKLKGLLAHRMKSPGSLPELLEKLADMALDELTPKSTTSPARSKPTEGSRSIPAAIRRHVWLRAKGRCEHADAKTGERCRSTWALQIDHRRPFAAGGDHSPENLRLLCRAHNQLRAARFFGEKKMRRYFEKPNALKSNSPLNTSAAGPVMNTGDAPPDHSISSVPPGSFT